MMVRDFGRSLESFNEELSYQRQFFPYPKGAFSTAGTCPPTAHAVVLSKGPGAFGASAL